MKHELTELSDDQKEGLSKIGKTFISSASVAGQVIQLASDSHRRYWAAIRESEKHLGGAKPKDPKLLKKAGLAWSANYNHGKAKAKLEQGAAENYGEIMRALSVASPEFRFPKASDSKKPILAFLEDPIFKEFIGAHLMTNFMDMLENDPRFSGFLVHLETQAYAYGYGTAVREGNRDYLGTSLHPLAIAFKPESKVDDIPMWIIFSTMQADQLWRIWQQKKTGKVKEVKSDNNGTLSKASDHWSLAAIERVLFTAYGGTVSKLNSESGETEQKQPDCWDDVLNQYMIDSSGVVGDTSMVRVAKIWNREVDGSYTETYVTYDPSPDATETASQDAGELMYQRNYPNTTAAEKISIIRDSAISPNGHIQEFRGLAKYAIENGKRYDRQKNSLADKMLLAGNPMILQPSSRQGKQFKIGVHSGFCLMPQGYSLPTNQPRFDLRPHVDYMANEEQDYRRETQSYDSKITGRLSSRPNKDEIQQVSRDSGKAIGAKLNIKFSDYAQMMLAILQSIPNLKPTDPNIKKHLAHFYDSMSWSLREVLSNDRDDHKGEINEIIKACRFISIEKVSGDVDSLRLSLSMAESPYEINRLERMILLSLGHTRREVNRLKPAIFESKTTYEDERVASIENDMFMRTAEVVYRSTDDPIVHLDMHMSKFNRVLETVKEGAMDPVEAFSFGKRLMNHMVRHLEKLQASRFLQKFEKKYVDNYKFMLNQLEQLKKFAQQMAQQIAQQQAEGAEGNGEQGIDPVDLKKIQLLELKHVTNEQRKEQLYEIRTQRESEMFANREERKNVEQQARIQREKENAEIKNRLKVIEKQITIE